MTYQENVRAAINHAHAVRLIAFIGTSHAAVLITIDDQGNTATDIFDNQVYSKKSIREFASLMMSR